MTPDEGKMSVEQAVEYGLRCNTRITNGEWLNAPATAAASLAVEVQRLHGMRCATCKHSFVGMAPVGRPHFRYCHKTLVPVPELGTQTFAQCEAFGGGCMAWEKRDV